MAIYSGLLRVIIHVFALFWIALFTILGFAVGAEIAGKFGIAVGVEPFVGATIGFGVGIFYVAFFFGMIALLFEIRDSLKSINQSQSMLSRGINRPRVEPSLNASA
jgi:hypothetical protein